MRSLGALLAAFGACLFFASADEGATALSSQSWLTLVLAVVATAAASAWLYGNGLRLQISRTGLAGIAALVGFAVWAAASIAWSVAPDRSWAHANVVLGYALVALIGAMLGSSLPRAAERTGVAIAVVSLPIALYALGGRRSRA